MSFYGAVISLQILYIAGLHRFKHTKTLKLKGLRKMCLDLKRQKPRNTADVCEGAKGGGVPPENAVLGKRKRRCLGPLAGTSRHRAELPTLSSCNRCSIPTQSSAPVYTLW